LAREVVVTLTWEGWNDSKNAVELIKLGLKRMGEKTSVGRTTTTQGRRGTTLRVKKNRKKERTARKECSFLRDFQLGDFPP